MDGMTVREIGRRLGISHVMVVKIKSRICKKYMQFRASMSN
jgi:DNA-directed RNA polymerase specialized sigma subunit